MILCSRLQLWFKPFREQAGAQAGHGCLEHIMTLRLITDFAKRKKMKLYVIYVDFAQAYDKVPRTVLFHTLKRLGCGATMLLSLVAMYKVTNCVIGTAVIAASVGVRQGSLTSCLLFILFVNDLIKLYKENCNVDGFLRWLHLLVFMDDTVVISTTRQGATEKLRILANVFVSHGMRVNTSKTKFMVINGDVNDENDLVSENLDLKACDHYLYLGSHFTSDGLASSAIKLHANMKMCQALKFVSFCKKINDVPFFIKKQAALPGYMVTH